MRFAVFKIHLRAVAARLSLAALALAMGIGGAAAISHPGLLDALQPSLNASGFACKSTAGKLLPTAGDRAFERDK